MTPRSSTSIRAGGIDPRLLFFVAHGIPAYLALLVATGVLTTVWAVQRANDPQFSRETRVQLPVLLLGSLLVAMLGGLSTRTRLRWLDDISPRPLAPWRLRHGLLLCALAVAALAPAGALGRHGFGLLFAARDVTALIGLALTAACVIGATLSWAIPLVYVVLTYFLAADPAPTWNVLLTSTGNHAADLISACATATGLALYTRYGDKAQR